MGNKSNCNKVCFRVGKMVGRSVFTVPTEAKEESHGDYFVVTTWKQSGFGQITSNKSGLKTEKKGWMPTNIPSVWSCEGILQFRNCQEFSTEECVEEWGNEWNGEGYLGMMTQSLYTVLRDLYIV